MTGFELIIGEIWITEKFDLTCPKIPFGVLFEIKMVMSFWFEFSKCSNKETLIYQKLWSLSTKPRKTGGLEDLFNCPIMGSDCWCYGALLYTQQQHQLADLEPTQTHLRTFEKLVRWTSDMKTTLYILSFSMLTINCLCSGGVHCYSMVGGFTAQTRSCFEWKWLLGWNPDLWRRVKWQNRFSHSPPLMSPPPLRTHENCTLWQQFHLQTSLWRWKSKH